MSSIEDRKQQQKPENKDTQYSVMVAIVISANRTWALKWMLCDQDQLPGTRLSQAVPNDWEGGSTGPSLS